MEKIEFQDPLKKYFQTEKIEKAPDGFTGNIMSRIGIEAKTVSRRRLSVQRFRVPLVSASVIVLLVLAAVFAPINQTDTGFTPILKLISNIKFTIPDLSIMKGQNLHFPDWTLYGFAGLILIAFADKALFAFFHRSDRQ
jgi:hypothetical protein